jgi:hypothetical protein
VSCRDAMGGRALVLVHAQAKPVAACGDDSCDGVCVHASPCVQAALQLRACGRPRSSRPCARVHADSGRRKVASCMRCVPLHAPPQVPVAGASGCGACRRRAGRATDSSSCLRTQSPARSVHSRRLRLLWRRPGAARLVHWRALKACSTASPAPAGERHAHIEDVAAAAQHRLLGRRPSRQAQLVRCNTPAHSCK